MFVVLLKFAENQALAGQTMEGHKHWIEMGFAHGVFLMTGSLEPGLGGSILAHNISREELEDRVAGDPFVEAGVVTAEIIEITPGRTDERLAFLMD